MIVFYSGSKPMVDFKLAEEKQPKECMNQDNMKNGNSRSSRMGEAVLISLFLLVLSLSKLSLRTNGGYGGYGR